MEEINTDPSYPPLIRHSNPTSPHQISNGRSLQLPLLDLQNLDSSLLSQSCKNWGLFRLTNHGIPLSLSSRLFDSAKEMMSRPFDSKKSELSCDSIEYFWGTPAVSLNLKELNWLEGLHVSLSRLRSDIGREGLCRQSSLFRDLTSEYGNHMARIARKLFDEMSIDLKLDRDQSISYLSEWNGTFRVYRYPLCPEPYKHLGMEAHTDSSVLTILNQDAVGGLQVFHENEWFDVQPIANTLIVNLGDMMQAISNDEYKSVEHRVLASGTAERFSLGYFVFPNEDSIIRSSNYNPFTYKQFRAQVQEDIKNTGSKVGLKRFK